MKNDKSFRDIVCANFSKMDILKHYPYGDIVDWSYWLCGDVNLKKVHLLDHNKGKTEMDYVVSIMGETARAMNYMVLHHGNFDPNDRQTITAFGMWELFDCGWVGWNKKLIKGKTLDEILAIEKVQNMRNEKIHKSANYKTKNYKNAVREFREDNRKKYGVYEVKHFPLLSRMKKPLYTKQQLAAIALIVDCEFENLC